jgi:hypothetical protein
MFHQRTCFAFSPWSRILKQKQLVQSLSSKNRATFFNFESLRCVILKSSAKKEQNGNRENHQHRNSDNSDNSDHNQSQQEESERNPING